MSSSRYLWSRKQLLGLKYNFKIKLVLPKNLLSTFRKYGLLKSSEELGMCFTLGVDTNLLIIINRIPTLEGAANPAKIPRHLLRKVTGNAAYHFIRTRTLKGELLLDVSLWNYLSLSTNCDSGVLEKTLKKKNVLLVCADFHRRGEGENTVRPNKTSMLNERRAFSG